MLIKVSFGVFFSEYSAKFHSNNSFESRLLFETKSKPPLVKCTCIADKQRLVELSISFYRTPIVLFIFLWQKICFYCGSKSTIKRGHLNGSQRWYCKCCKRSFVGHNRLTNTIVNNRYSKGNLTVKDLSEEYGVSTRTIYRKLSKSYKEELPNLLVRPVVVLMDATYWGRNFGMLSFRRISQFQGVLFELGQRGDASRFSRCGFI